MNKTLIVSGGDIKIELLQEIYKRENFNTIIAVDKGLELIDKLNIFPNYIIGDFDSVNDKILQKYINKNSNIIKLNPEKDYTDTHTALKIALEIKSNKIYILAALGKRMDHTIANIHILKEALDKNVECIILDENNEIQLINKYTELKKDKNYKYISLIPLTTKTTAVTLTGLKYLLKNATLYIGNSIGVSNEQIDNLATIDIKDGILILIKSRD